MNPYLILGVPADADDARIRNAYLAAVRAAPPETHPTRFKEVAAAYDQIKDETRRLRHELFDTSPPGTSPLEVFLQHARLAPPALPPGFEPLKQFLRACAKP
jgi:curved DNA-binding protein CbpA